MNSQNTFLTESERERRIQTFKLSQSKDTYFSSGYSPNFAVIRVVTSQGERSRTANPKIHDRTVLIAFSADCLHFLCCGTKQTIGYSSCPLFEHKKFIRSIPGVHSQTEICDEKYWKVQSVLDSDVTRCRVSIVSSSQNSWAKAPLHQSAETTGRAAETDNFLQSAGRQNFDSPHVRMHRSYPPVIKNGDGGNPRRKLSHMVGFSTSSVSTKTWVIFQPWSWWHQTVNMKLLDILFLYCR